MFNRRKSRSPFANLLAWDGKAITNASLSKLQKERFVMRDFLALKAAQIDRVFEQNGFGLSSFPKPARSVQSYRAEIFSEPVPQNTCTRLSEHQKFSKNVSIFHDCPLK